MRSWLGAVTAALVVAWRGAGAPGPRVPPTAPSALAGPSRAGALARHLVAEMTFPPGTKPFPPRSLPRSMRNPGAPAGEGWVRAERVLLAPVKPPAAWAVVQAHAPFNEPGAMGPAAVNGLAG